MKIHDRCTRTLLLCVCGFGIILFTGSANAATYICSGFGPGPSGNAFKDSDCDYNAIGAFLGVTLVSNDDIYLIDKDEDPDNAGGNKRGWLEVDDDAGGGDTTVEWTQTGGFQPVVWVEKYDSIYDVYAYTGPSSSPFSDNAMRPDHGSMCDKQGINCTADTSYVATYRLSPVPLPAAVWLLGSALLVLAGVGRLSKHRV